MSLTLPPVGNSAQIVGRAMTPEALTMVATDGHRLAYVQFLSQKSRLKAGCSQDCPTIYAELSPGGKVSDIGL
jgi:hypothetical protein